MLCYAALVLPQLCRLSPAQPLIAAGRRSAALARTPTPLSAERCRVPRVPPQWGAGSASTRSIRSGTRGCGMGCRCKAGSRRAPPPGRPPCPGCVRHSSSSDAVPARRAAAGGLQEGAEPAGGLLRRLHRAARRSRGAAVGRDQGEGRRVLGQPTLLCAAAAPRSARAPESPPQRQVAGAWARLPSDKSLTRSAPRARQTRSGATSESRAPTARSSTESTP